MDDKTIHDESGDDVYLLEFNSVVEVFVPEATAYLNYRSCEEIAHWLLGAAKSMREKERNDG